MTYPTALALFSAMPEHEQMEILDIFTTIHAAFDDVRDAFAQAVSVWRRGQEEGAPK